MSPVRINITPLAFQKLRLMPDPDKERKQALAEQQAQQARVAEALSAAAQPPPTPSGAFTGMQNGPYSTPVQAPEFGQDFLGAGGSPGQLVDVIRSMDPSQRDHFAEALQASKNAVLNGEPIDLQPEPLRGPLRDIFKVKAPFDPNSIKSRQDFERGKALGQIPPEMVPQFEQAFPQAPPARPTSVDSFLLTDPAEYDRNFGQGAYQQTYDRLKGGGKIKDPNDNGGDKAKKPLTDLQALNEVQQRAYREQQQLENDLYDVKDSSTQEWKDMPKDERATYTKDSRDKSGRTYYRLKDKAPEDQVSRLKAVNKYLLDFNAQKRGADSLQAILSQPTGDTGTPGENPTPVEMATAMGLSGADLQEAINDPDLAAVFQAWQKAQGAGVR